MAQARRPRSAACSAFGYDWVPGNLAGALALREAGEGATRVDIGSRRGGSKGTSSLSGTTPSSCTPESARSRSARPLSPR
jgi:hypothetical protein